MKNLYCGAAGVAWALDALRRRGHAEPALDPADVARRALELFRREPDFMTDEAKLPQRHSSLLVGEAGIVFTLWRLAPSDELADDLHTLVRANVGNISNELMWGVPGTLLAARALLAATGDDRWRDAVSESEADLRAGRDDEGLWTQQLYGHHSRIIGPVHGLIGNVLALDGAGQHRRRAQAHGRRRGRACELAAVGRLERQSPPPVVPRRARRPHPRGGAPRR